MKHRGALRPCPSRRTCTRSILAGILLLFSVSEGKALLILAPAPGEGHFAEAVTRVPSLAAPVLLLVEAGDDSSILDDFDMLERALRVHGKEERSIRYDRGGGHRLFYSLGYYWDDVRTFLREKVAHTTSR